MTTTEKPTTRVTKDKFIFTLSGPSRNDRGREIVITVSGNDLIFREKGLRSEYTTSFAEIFNKLQTTQKPDHEVSRADESDFAEG